MAILSAHLDFDLAGIPLDAIMAERTEPELYRMRTRFHKQDGTPMTVAEVAARHGQSVSLPQFVGTPAGIADQMEAFMAEVGGDGFMLSAIHSPGAIEEFVTSWSRSSSGAACTHGVPGSHPAGDPPADGLTSGNARRVVDGSDPDPAIMRPAFATREESPCEAGQDAISSRSRGPTNVPDRVLGAIGRPTIDHRGPEFAALGRACLDGMRRIFRTAGAGLRLSRLRHRGVGGGARQHPVEGRPGARVRDRSLRAPVGGGGPAARTRSGDHRGRLALRRRRGGGRGGSRAGRRRRAPGRSGPSRCSTTRRSTGAASDVPAVRRALDTSGHPALLLVDTVSSLASMPYEHDGWGVT